ncbi:MAG TPA: hypothetical protein VH277_10670 [Gemmatimonadaceae bacterium]|jgi:hypothetical protein|nr:hypothetical protein [Gemmatimonadaceae bacterium]
MRTTLRNVRCYRRELPGGGYVAIVVTSERSLWGQATYRGKVIAERRARSRGERHEPPVIAEAEGRSADSVVQQLLPVAESNVAIGAALVRGSRVRLSPSWSG